MTRFLDDFSVGDRFMSGGMTLTDSQIIDFAMRYDPQPFHVDVTAAAQSVFGGLAASGFQTQALAFRLFWDTGTVAGSNLGAFGIEEVRFPRPVMAGDTIRVEVEVKEVRPSSSKPDRGVLRLAYAAFNQRDEPVLTMTVPHLVRRRPS